MTDKVTVEWMKKEGYYKRWLVPVLGLNEKITVNGTPPENQTFAHRPTGDSPEMMVCYLACSFYFIPSAFTPYMFRSHSTAPSTKMWTTV